MMVLVVLPSRKDCSCNPMKFAFTQMFWLSLRPYVMAIYEYLEHVALFT